MAFNKHDPKLIDKTSEEVLEVLYIWGFSKEDAKLILTSCLDKLAAAKWPEHIDKPN